jgi:NAD(P)-dependent dehydrogenase (short-subunit alcohol dehydrogenase family)
VIQFEKPKSIKEISDMDSSLETKVVIVTGCASGIGLATARKLLDLGAVVHGIDRAEKLLKAIESDVFIFHGGVDVSSRSAVTEVYQKIRERNENVYGLVNCAGIAPYSGTYLETDEDYLTTVAVNQHGTWFMSTEFLRHIEEHTPKEGDRPKPSTSHALVNIGSSASLQGYSALTAYVTSKHAILGMTRSWAIDYAQFGVRINVVAPGGVDTPLARAQEQHSGPRSGNTERGMNPVPMARMADPSELANAIVFLLSDQASYITGQVIPVNGGYPTY